VKRKKEKKKREQGRRRRKEKKERTVKEPETDPKSTITTKSRRTKRIPHSKLPHPS
jgi:hypothetical protein